MLVLSSRAAGERVIRIAGELVVEVDECAAGQERCMTLLGDAGNVVEDGAGVVRGRGERATHGRRFRALFKEPESGSECRTAHR